MNKLRKTLLSLWLWLPFAVFAHDGTPWQGDVATGLIHPFTGVDHLLAAVVVAALASGVTRRLQWLIAPLIAIIVAVVATPVGAMGFGVGLFLSSWALMQSLAAVFGILRRKRLSAMIRSES